jgi:4-oxalocrotonate tautomerase
MPYVNVKITREGNAPGQSAATREQKAELIAGITQLLHDVLGKHPSTTFVVIDEIELDNWGVGGLQVPEYRDRAAAAAKKS